MCARVSLSALAGSLAPGDRLFVPGSAGEPAGLLDAILADRERPIEIVTTAVPGINPLHVDPVPPGVTLTGLFMQPGLARAQREGRFRHLPLSYSGFVRHLREGPAFDACVLHVAPPGPDGRCSLGPAVEFTPLAAARSRRLLGVINPAMPRIPGAESVPLADFDLVAESEAPLRTYDVGAPGPEATRIADGIARLIADGSTIQVGLGKVPDALLGLLGDRRGLKIHSGMLSDSLERLATSGALDPAFRPTACVLVGTAGFYARLDGRDDIDVLDCSVTHGPARLGAIQRFVAVNSALSVDLFGQCNLEIAAGAAVSGAGGAPDFARAARQSPGGLSIVALPSSFAGGRSSRIVPRLSDELVSLPRVDVDVVVTEEGMADLRGRSVHERAEALAGVAAPAHRADLMASWRDIAARL